MQLTDATLQEGVDELNRLIERLKIDLKRHDNDAASQFLSLEDKINQHYVSKYQLEEVVDKIMAIKDNS